MLLRLFDRSDYARRADCGPAAWHRNCVRSSVTSCSTRPLKKASIPTSSVGIVGGTLKNHAVVGHLRSEILVVQSAQNGGPQPTHEITRGDLAHVSLPFEILRASTVGEIDAAFADFAQKPRQTCLSNLFNICLHKCFPLGFGVTFLVLKIAVKKANVGRSVKSTINSIF